MGRPSRRAVGPAFVLALSVAAVSLAPVGAVDPPTAPDRTVASASSEPAPGVARPQGEPLPSRPVPGPGSGPASPTPETVDPGGARPVSIAIPAADVDAPVIDLGIQGDGSIEVPQDPDDVGWLDASPAPGQQGPAVVAGHVDSTTGPAVFARLGELSPGQEIVVGSEDGSSERFTVDDVRTYAQDDFPTADVYGPVPGPALRLITCGGIYDEDRGGYQDNVVVYAS